MQAIEDEDLPITDLVLSSNKLPDTIPELVKFISDGNDVIKMFKAQLSRLKNINGANDFCEKCLVNGQIYACILIDAQVRLGEYILRLPDFHSSGKGTMKRKQLPEGIEKKKSHYAQQLAKHPELVEEAKRDAVANGDLPLRSHVIQKIEAKKQYSNWKAEWQGLPEFEQEDLTSFRKIIVHFQTENDVDNFSKLIGQKLSPKSKSIWFPEQQIRHHANKLYIDES